MSFSAAGPVGQHRGAAGEVVGRHALGVAEVARDHAEVAVLDAGVEAHAVAPVPERVVERGDDHVALLAGDVAGREVDHRAGVVDGDEVAPVRDLVGREVDAHRRRLDRRATGVELDRVVAEDGEVADVAPGREPGRDHLGQADLRASRPGCARWGMRAASSGVRPSSSASGSSAQPSGTSTMYFIARQRTRGRDGPGPVPRPDHAPDPPRHVLARQAHHLDHRACSAPAVVLGTVALGARSLRSATMIGRPRPPTTTVAVSPPRCA